MRTFTLYTNCLIALDEADVRAEAAAVRALANAHAQGTADVAFVAISASEKQKGGGHIENFSEFRRRLGSLALDHLPLLMPMMYWDVTFLDWSLWTDSEMERVEREIHEILFPNIEFLWADYCTARNLSVDDLASGVKWRNAKCDVQALWTHIFHKRDVFVSSDRNFHLESKKPLLITLGAGAIETPEAAILLALNEYGLARRVSAGLKD